MGKGRPFSVHRTADRARIRTRRGMTMLELLIAVVSFTIGVGALSAFTVSVFALSQGTRDRAVAIQGVRNMVETLHATAFEEVFAEIRLDEDFVSLLARR